MIIYKIQNKLNGKIYIGQTTKTLTQRKSSHIYRAKNELNRKSLLYKSMRKEGIDNFEFIQIKECDNVEDLYEDEKYFIELYKTTNPKYGYNTLSGGDSGGDKRPIKNITTGKIFESVTAAAIHDEAIRNNISAVLTNKRKTAGGYKYIYQ